MHALAKLCTEKVYVMMMVWCHTEEEKLAIAIRFGYVRWIIKRYINMSLVL